MSKNDYVAIARALASTRPTPFINPDKSRQWEMDLEAICHVLEQDNSRFDKVRFLEACGLVLERKA